MGKLSDEVNADTKASLGKRLSAKGLKKARAAREKSAKAEMERVKAIAENMSKAELIETVLGLAKELMEAENVLEGVKRLKRRYRLNVQAYGIDRDTAELELLELSGVDIDPTELAYMKKTIKNKTKSFRVERARMKNRRLAELDDLDDLEQDKKAKKKAKKK
jgi:hypothetical protein